MNRRNDHQPIDDTALNLMLSQLRLPTIKALWPQFTAQADREGWPGARLLAALTEQELAERSRRRFLRQLRERGCRPVRPSTRSTSAVPLLSKAHVMALCAGDRWLDEGANLLLIGPPGAWQEPSRGRHRLGAHRARLPGAVHPHHRPHSTAAGARRELSLEAAIAKLDKYHLLILDDAYVTKDQAETSVLFELITAR